MGRVVMEIWAPAAAAPMAKVKQRRRGKLESLLSKNMERELHTRAVTTVLFDPNLVVKIPPMNEKRRYPNRMPPLKRPIWV
jgi:hypothetical protein